MDRSDRRAAERLRLALDLFGAGEAMMRQKVRREHPGASEAEIERRLELWRLERPGAEQGDGVGVPRPWKPAA
jgi:hypothetical protein